MISKLRHRLGVSSIIAVLYMAIYILSLGLILSSIFIYWWLPIGIIFSLMIIYMLLNLIISVIDILNKMNGIIFGYIFSRIFDEKN